MVAVRKVRQCFYRGYVNRLNNPGVCECVLIVALSENMLRIDGRS
jgi:hypothetical protein